VAGWLVATVLFVAPAAATRGPGSIDSSESIYSTWAIAHGQLACAFPSITLPHEPLIAPVYPIYSGVLAAMFHIGASLPFPSRAAMGAHCGTAIVAIRAWAFHSGAYLPTLWIAFTGWFVLMAGVVAWLRACGRGRRGWEPVTLIVLACLPPLWVTVSFYFHPQDLVALGFALAAMACAVRGRWAGAGVLIALAVLSQQYALLVAAPLLVLAPNRRRARFIGAALAGAALVLAPFLAAGSTGALRAAALGSGDNPSVGGTMMWFVTHHGPSMVLLSRILPITVALVAAAYVSRRLGPAVLAPPALGSLVAFCLTLRLLFEQNFFAYYPMALLVMLILADVVRGNIRGSMVAWVASLTMVFTIDGYFLKITSRLHGENIIPLLVILTAIGLAVYGVLRQRTWSSWSRLLWLAFVACTVVTWPSPVNPLLVRAPTWVWQALFAVTGAMLAAGPLLEDIRDRTPEAPQTLDEHAADLAIS
jgi:hypothetical protein